MLIFVIMQNFMYMQCLNTRIHVLRVPLSYSFVLNSNPSYVYDYQRYMPGNPLLGNTWKSSTSTSSRKLGVIIGVVVGGTSALATILFFVTYFVCFHHRTNRNGRLPLTSDVPMPHFSKSKMLGTGGTNRQTFDIGKSSRINKELNFKKIKQLMW